MKKLSLLKAIVDLLWIFSTPIILMLLGLSFAIFFVDPSEFNIKINTINFNEKDLLSKVLFAISSLNYLLIIAALYFFRKVLHYFTRIKIFEETVLKLFQKIGNLLMLSGFISLSISIIGEIYFKQKITLAFGLNQHLVIICLGLFFLVLSEIFKIAISTKQENDLTI
ncbi:hypothetical protein PI23P_03237 [Polaribacter irgensii 23-P]|jgi:uncharacterized membrane protein (DUF373 family)|uniref:DUF2975 domain-containing protein n=1 Tax=Polaribacter irgensii 23-P TaxID=313594 RepID=A4BWY4_9FLAO|nr:DUF2975 domain-containing protein [Polaribacter irgensii]EAR13475.1 hypothetical protein PI23P_03237 [Polaribacter irgensii 23-P]